MATRMANKYPSIGQRIKQARLEIGMPQRELAGDDYSRSYISQVERSIVIPSLDSLITIGHRLGKPAAWFLMANDEKVGYRFLHKQDEVTLMDLVRTLEKGVVSWMISVLKSISRFSSAELAQLQEITNEYLKLNASQRGLLLQVLREIKATDESSKHLINMAVSHAPPQTNANP